MTDRRRLPAASRRRRGAAALAAALFPVCAAAAAATVTNSAGIALVEIPPGSFSMGSTSGDWDERPVRTVTIGAPFLIGATEVTNAQYERFDPAHRALRGKLGFSAGDDEAAVFVSWHEAAAFCRWLSEKEGAHYRLPTEAEWEYACRAGTTTAYSTGDALPAAFRKNATMCWYPDPRAAVPVDLTAGATPANAWGLYDMHGNVEEWCLDWYGPYEAEDATDPVGRADGDFRVTRGGSHSTTVEYLRSANRSGTLPEDRSWLIGFRVVRAPPPRTQPLPPPAPPLNRQNVRQEIPPDLARGPDPARPYFKGPRRFVAVPPGSDGPLFSKHNHDPAIVDCPNGDLLAIWYTCRSEPGRELAIAASRLRHGAEEWDPPSPFWDAPDRNDHAPALWVDAKGTIYHFNGLSAAATWGNLATVMRTSTDSGATWSKARLIMPEHGLRHMPVESVIATRDGALVVPCDAVTGGNGGTAIIVSRDAGATWTDPGEGRPAPRFAAGATGAWIAGIHAGLVELDDGRLLALGRGDSIAGRMPMSISADQGATWTYAASPFPPIGGGQRLALLRLREGPILACSFGTDVTMRDASGRERRGSGLFAALSTDEGRSWTIKRLVTPGGPPREVDGGGNTGRFTMRGDAAEPRGYLSICQTPDRTIHLLSSAQHYAFNLAWLDEPAVAEAPAALDDCNVVCQTPSPDAAGAMPVGNGEVGASVWIEPGGDVLLYLARSDSFSEACRLLKLGRIRVSFRPAPRTDLEGFHQELKLREGRFEADLGDMRIEVFVEPDRPVVRIAARADRPFAARVAYEGWRRERRVLNGTAELADSGWTMQGGPPSVRVEESADVVVAAGRAPAALAWYHHNADSVVPVSLRLQSCDRLAGAFDPLLHRTFGAWIEGPGLRRDGPEALASAAPATSLDLRIACPSLVAPEVERWLERAHTLARDAPDPEAARASAEAWWRAFWARSWIFVHRPVVRRNAVPLRIGSDARGGARFSGELGRVGVYARALRASEIAQLARGDPCASAPDIAGRVLSAVAPAPGEARPELDGTELDRGFTVEAWIRPAGESPGRILDKFDPEARDGFFLDIPGGRSLRLAAGGMSIAPPTLDSTSTASASHVFNTLSALNDGEDISSSCDLSLDRFTWWDRRGTREWVQYDFKEPAEVSGAEVYWFDDTPRGGACKIPEWWRILARDADGSWRPVRGAESCAAHADAYDAVSFPPVRTSALRIEVRLRDGFSGGILEWRVREAEEKRIVDAGVWQHVAATCSPQGAMTLYRDGGMAAHRPQRRPASVSQAYALQRFVTACQARGEAPIKFNGGIFTVEPRLCDPALAGSPDWRRWGDGYWYQNTRLMYHPMPAAGDTDLMAPFFAFYGRALPLAQARAKSWYGAEGAFFPETMNIFGAYPNRDYGWDRAGRAPGDVWCTAWKTAWNQGPEIVALMLDRWDYTGDAAFLRDELLPMARAVLRYFDTRFRKEQGRIVIDPTQAVETFRTDVLDDMPSVAGLRAITARLCELPGTLTTGEERALFARMHDACPLLPMEEKEVGGVKKRSLAPARTYKLEGWNCENADLYAVWPFRLFGVGRPDLEVARTAYLTRRYAVDNGWGYDGNAAAVLGLAGEAARILIERCRNSHPAFRFPAAWGPNFDWLPDQTHGGNLMHMAQLMLVQPAGRKILLLPAWPPAWDVSFRLHAPARTVIECEVRKGRLTRLVVTPESRRADVEICAPFAAD